MVRILASAGIAALVFTSALLARQVNEHEWPVYPGNTGFTGFSPDASLKPPLKLLWSYRLDGDASGDAGAGVIVAGGKVFVNVNNTRSIVALDAHTGRFAWEYKDSYVGYMNVPSYSDGWLFLWERSSKKLAVLALDAATGKSLWKQPIGSDLGYISRTGLPVVDGKVFCGEGGDEPALLAFDAQSGKQLWRAALGNADGGSVSSPAVAGGKLFVGLLDSRGFRNAQRGVVVALEATSGKELWRRNDVLPHRDVVSDGKIVTCTSCTKDNTKSYCLDASTGKTLWIGPPRFHYNPTTITDDLVLIRPYGASCFGIDRETGKERWHFEIRGVSSGCCAPAVSGQFAYYGTGVVNPGDLESLASFQHVNPPRERGISGTMLRPKGLKGEVAAAAQ